MRLMISLFAFCLAGHGETPLGFTAVFHNPTTLILQRIRWSRRSRRWQLRTVYTGGFVELKQECIPPSGGDVTVLGD